MSKYLRTSYATCQYDVTMYLRDYTIPYRRAMLCFPEKGYSVNLEVKSTGLDLSSSDIHLRACSNSSNMMKTASFTSGILQYHSI